MQYKLMQKIIQQYPAQRGNRQSLQKWSVLLFLLCWLPAQAQIASKLRIGGIASSTAWFPGQTTTPLSGGGDYPTINNRFALLLDFDVDETISAFASLESYQGGAPIFYSIGLNWRISQSPALLLRAGKFLAPFGNFLPRRHDSENALIGRPVAYFYQHNLSSSVLPARYEELLATRGMGHGLPYGNDAETGSGMRIFWRETYVSGVQLVGEASRFRYIFAITNGSLSNGGNVNNSDTFNFAGRVLFTPLLGLHLGASFSSGAYLNGNEVDEALDSTYKKREDYRQTVFGADVNYSYGHLELWGEYVRNSYGTPFLPDNLDASAMSAEAKYKINVRLYAAARFSALLFDKIPDATDVDADGELRETWDYDASQLELGLGYRLHRHGFAKISYRINTTHDVPQGDPADNVAALQLVVFF